MSAASNGSAAGDFQALAVEQLVEKWVDITCTTVTIEDDVTISDANWSDFIECLRMVASAASQVGEAAPFGVGIVCKGVTLLLGQLEKVRTNREAVMLLAVDVALVYEMFKEFHNVAAEEGPDKCFYESNAGRLHTRALYQALKEAKDVVAQLAPAPPASTTQNATKKADQEPDQTSCAPFRRLFTRRTATVSPLRPDVSILRAARDFTFATSDAEKLRTARERLDMARRHFCEAIQMQATLSAAHKQQVKDPISQLAKRLKLSETKESKPNMLLLGVKAVSASDEHLKDPNYWLSETPKCMAWNASQKCKCEETAEMVFLVTQEYRGSAVGGPWIICVCKKNHGRSNGFLGSNRSWGHWREILAQVLQK